MSYFTVGRESRAAPGRQFNRPAFHLGVEQFDRGAGPMGSGIEIGGHPATTKRGQRRTERFVRAQNRAPVMGAGVTDLVEMLAR